MIPVLGRERNADHCEFKAWFTELVLGQPELLRRETLSQKAKDNNTKNDRVFLACMWERIMKSYSYLRSSW